MSAVLLSLPGAGERDDDVIELVELEADGSLWGGSRGDRDAYGTAADVIASLSQRPPADPWVRAAAAALGREETWGIGGGWRRPFLEVVQGSDQVFYHVTAAANRASIRRHGLDWRRMGAAPGVAGSPGPELPGVFVCDAGDVSFFLRMARSPSDVWSVDVGGFWLETGPDGWWVINHPVPSHRLRLVAQEVRERASEPFG